MPYCNINVRWFVCVCQRMLFISFVLLFPLSGEAALYKSFLLIVFRWVSFSSFALTALGRPFWASGITQLSHEQLHYPTFQRLYDSNIWTFDQYQQRSISSLCS